MMNWVSVKESLPEKADNYLVTTEITNPFSGYKVYDTKTAYFTPSNWIVHETEECIPGEVIAWKELDAPYGKDYVPHICKTCSHWFKNNDQTPLFYKTPCPWRNNDVPMPNDSCSKWANKDEKR